MADETKNAKVNEQGEEKLSDHDLDAVAGGGDVVPMDTFSLNFGKIAPADKLKAADAAPSRSQDDVWVDGKIITD